LSDDKVIYKEILKMMKNLLITRIIVLIILIFSITIGK
jgi:hypothetical protein